jgi:hypothetical protein
MALGFLNMAMRTTLRIAFASALKGEMPSCWMYLKDEELINLESECLLLEDDEIPEDNAIPETAETLGFPVEGPDSQSIESCIRWARGLQQNPDEDLLLRSFVYYWKFDAFLPSVDAADPPVGPEAALVIDRSIYDGFGPEREGTTCKSVGCARGLVAFSSLCRPHHFESITGHPCPFSH